MTIMSDLDRQATRERLDDVATVRRDILLLSTLLEGVRPGDSTTTCKSNINQVGDLAVWSHVASIISAWSPGDSQSPTNGADAGTSVAVTGRLEPGRIVAAVGTTSSTDDKSELTQTCSLQLAEEIANMSGTHVARSLGSLDSLQSDVPLSTHLRDVVSIVEWLAGMFTTDTPDESSRHSDRIFHIFGFLVKRGYKQLLARLRTGSALWKDHPLVVIHNFYCQCIKSTRLGADSASVDSESIPDSSTVSGATASATATRPLEPPRLRIRTFPLKNLTKFRRLLERHEIYESVPCALSFEPPSDTGTYTVSSSNAASWADLLHTCYATLLASDSRASPNGDRPGSNYPETLDDCAVLYDAMAALHELLRAGIVNHLITESVRKELERRYTEVTEARSTSLEIWDTTEDDLRETMVGFSIQFDRELTFYLVVSFDSPVHLKGTHLIPVLANDLQADGELPRRHVMRYLHSLVQPYSAASDLVAYFANSPNLPLPLRFDIYHMDVASYAAERGRDLGDADYERIVDELLQPRATDASESSLDDTAETRRALDLLKESTLARARARAKVHPEAALMSLPAGGWRSAAVRNKSGEGPLHDVFAGGIAPDNPPIILPSGKRCCYCCALLAQSLRPSSDEVAGAGVDSDSEGSGSKVRPRRPLKFMLEPDGTHGVVEPWVPPDGVALEVLCDVRARLLDVLRREGAARRGV